jgi:hypothetical protein
MATIDKLDINVYNLYALRTKMIEQINQQLQLDKAASIPPQTFVVDYFPKLTELDILLGIVPVATPWALFLPPKRFELLRRSPFSFFRVAPAFGSLEEQEEDAQKLAKIPCGSPEEEKEKSILNNCLKKIDWINGMMSYIIGRVGQFLQG